MRRKKNKVHHIEREGGKKKGKEGRGREGGREGGRRIHTTVTYQRAQYTLPAVNGSYKTT